MPSQEINRGNYRVGLQHHIGIDEHQHLAEGGFTQLLTGPRLSQPSGGHVQPTYDPQAVVASGRFTDNGNSVIGAAVVQHDDLEPQITLAQDRPNGGGNPMGFVASRDEHAHEVLHGGGIHVGLTKQPSIEPRMRAEQCSPSGCHHEQRVIHQERRGGEAGPGWR